MVLGWFVVLYKRRNPGDLDETEILGDKTLVKVRASPTTLIAKVS